jgi:hypothetical protein
MGGDSQDLINNLNTSRNVLDESVFANPILLEELKK